MNFLALDGLSKSIEVKAKIRYNHREAKARLIPFQSDSAKVFFKEPQRAITPGQSVVFYRGDIVLGGGIIVNQKLNKKEVIEMKDFSGNQMERTYANNYANEKRR